MAEIVKKTRLQKHFYGMRLVTIGVNYCFIMSLFCLITPFMFILVPFIAMLYVIYALYVSLAMIVCTLFFILITVGQPDNPLHRVWDRLNHLDGMMEQVANFGRIAVPIVGSVAIILSIVLLILVSKNIGRQNKKRDRVFLILTIIFCVVGILFSQIFGYAVK